MPVFEIPGWDAPEKDTAAAREAERIRRMQRAVEHLCQTDEGVEFLRWILNESGFFTATYPREFKDAAWNEGKRSLACEIFSWCTATPSVMRTLFAMHNEENKE